MEVSFDLEDGVHPEDSLFDGIDLTLFVPGSDAGSDVGSLASSLESFATESDAGSDDDLGVNLRSATARCGNWLQSGMADGPWA